MYSHYPRIATLIDELESLARGRNDAWQIPRVEGELLYRIAVASGARLIVEVGTSYGFSGLFWGMALQRTGGMLHTIDVSQKKFDSSRQTFAQAGLESTVVNHLGDAAEVLTRIDGSIDIAFIDADKPATQRYFELLWPKLRVGGSVLTDNVTSHRKELAGFLSHVRGRPDAASGEIPIGNGVEWTVKLA